ncbi:unnamed protein product [Lymnaea stagnalis]|uniref:MANSC domain-containing protein n=1 Tax=Lymnaea stagnalis TaxID=6523 RepID=A0AAV2H9W5_LYMST
MESHYLLKILSIIIFFFTIIALVPIYAKKEFINDVPFKVDENLFIDIIKRLGNVDYPSERSDNSDLHDSVSTHKQINGFHSRQTCESTLRIGTIIKATESLSAGAAYIDSIKGVKSNDLCSEYCCRNISCDIAVYQDKGDRFCYLFNCDGKCIFKEHVGYFVTNIKHDMSEHPAEEDLHSLHAEAQTNGLGESEGNKKDGHLIGQEDGAAVTDIKHEAEAQVVTEATPRIVVTQSPTEPQEPVITPHSVGLGGYCTQSIQCEDPNAGCLDHNCYCKNGYYNKDGLCRKVCSPSEFECFELGTLSRGPECVARSQVCDSYMQCADGSDEFNCDPVDFPSGQRLQTPNVLNKLDANSVHHSSHEVNVESTDGQTLKATGPKPNFSPTKAPPVITTDRLNVSGPTTSTSRSPPPASTAKPGHAHRNDHVFMSSEKLIIASATSNAEGPIIALSLGLAFTVILLVLVGCRLRNVRHRLRKGRPLHQNEADYLINGMYL